MLNSRGTAVVILSVLAFVLIASKARANDDCPPRVEPSQVNCDEARGYVAALGLRESISRARRCGYSLREIVSTVKRCGLK